MLYVTNRYSGGEGDGQWKGGGKRKGDAKGTNGERKDDEDTEDLKYTSLCPPPLLPNSTYFGIGKMGRGAGWEGRRRNGGGAREGNGYDKKIGTGKGEQEQVRGRWGGRGKGNEGAKWNGREMMTGIGGGKRVGIRKGRGRKERNKVWGGRRGEGEEKRDRGLRGGRGEGRGGEREGKGRRRMLRGGRERNEMGKV